MKESEKFSSFLFLQNLSNRFTETDWAKETMDDDDRV
jgi:hypothetical protein